jgi:hypothetical protein
MIDITPFTTPIIFEAHSTLFDQRQLERKQNIEKAQKQLKELMDEIQKSGKA